jgi:LL-diaminopimelate aminotransferase
MPPYAFAVIGQRLAAMKAAGKDVIRLDIGSPDMPPPDAVVTALENSADNPKNHSYGSYSGDPGFRRAVAGYYQRRFGVELNPDTEVLPLIGSKEGIVNLALAYLDHGDAALVPDINYPAYSMGTLMAGGTPIEVPLDPANGYRPRFDQIKGDLSAARLLWVNYPNNPTGATADLDLYAECVAFCRDHHLLLCSDNPYAEVVYDGYRAPSALQVPGAKENTVEFMSLSKMYNMAGWRLGACVGNAEAIANLLVVKSNIDSGHFKPVYDAGTVALNDTPDSWLDERNAIYQARRDKIAATLPLIGLKAEKPRGSLYFWAKVDDGDDHAYVESALMGALVAFTPGTMYGEAGRGYVRISLGVEDRRLDEALERLKVWYNAR